MAASGRGLLLLAALVVVGCGARTPLREAVDAQALPRPEPTEERCNGLDDDLEGAVDEDFRDDVGRYVHADHCGGCDIPCRADGPRVRRAECVVLDEGPACAATACEEGFVPSERGRCVPAFDHLCLTCVDGGGCGLAPGAACEDVGGELRCTVGCGLGCPDGYACTADRCIPESGSCRCEEGDRFTLACALEDPEENRCPGSALCDDGELSECEAPPEVCDEVDNDCDGIVDEGFRDERGAYSLDRHHCGECGVDCTESEVPEGDLTCGGDPFAPTCVLECPDAEDGIQPGDRIDADRDIATGCECQVTSLDDEPGPVGAVGQELDLNCDGADGIVVESFYVATDGDDDGPGSPTRPLATIGAALERAAESLDADDPRPHVFIASGDYTETLELPDGVFVHGGYRRDFLALDPTGFRVEVRAPGDGDAPGGAALVANRVGRAPTVVEWVTLQGRDATASSEPAFGAVLEDPGPELVLRDMEVRSGVGGAGSTGAHGEVGPAPRREAGQGEAPRQAIEDEDHACIPGPRNTVAGGQGGTNRCDGTDVGGGGGGEPGCPRFAQFQPGGEPGRPAATVPGGGGGAGGQDSRGPITGPPCSELVCCGLADFTVPSNFSGPQAGEPGGNGRPGTAGQGCTDPLGRFDGDRWVPGTATGGSAGWPGSGGGGGGAGGGAEMDWFADDCEFPDGLGGGGGGGGAGGCGGEGGEPGTSGGPSVALLVRVAEDGGAPSSTLEGVVLRPADGGRGGDGGGGGDGALGGSGAFGGALAREDRSIPPLAGPFPGARGGPGGNGGAGGGGGGGCGGGSIGIWVTGTGPGPAPPAWRGSNDFRLGRPGAPGRGGGGGAPAADGSTGGAMDVVVR